MPTAARRCSTEARNLVKPGRRLAALAISLCAALLWAPAAAQAVPTIVVSPSLPSPAAVGQTLPASITLTNASTFEDPSFTVCKAGDGGACAGQEGIVLTPSCGADVGATCTAGGADPGVFTINGPVLGAQGTTCADVAFATASIDPAFGSVRFTPTGGLDVRLAMGQSCRLDFTVTVQRLPDKDARADAGVQTVAIATATARTYLDALTSGGGSSVATVTPAPPTPPASPAIGGVDPASPSSDNTPQVRGSAAAGTVVSVYAAAGCAGAPAAQGTPEAFASPGLTVTVPENATTTFSANVTDPATGLVSACSAPSTGYTEDSTAPQTTIGAGVPGASVTDLPVFTFASDDPGAGFTCRIDDAPFAPCISPFQVPELGAGAHTFQVRAVDALGNVDATPATRTFTLGAAFRPAGLSGCTLRGNDVTGTPDNDTLRGTSRTDVLVGLTGGDLLRGLGGRDCLFGQGGTDRLFGGTNADRLFGGTDNDSLFGEGGNDRLSGEAGRDRLDGGPGDDLLLGGSGPDVLTDRRGTDRLSGGLGIDRIDARDRSPADRRARDRISCGAGRDTVLVDRRDRVARDCENVRRRSL